MNEKPRNEDGVDAARYAADAYKRQQNKNMGQANSQGNPNIANTRQVGGDHYKVGGEEHWDRVSRLHLDYFQGQITKYVERWRHKNGVEDLQKARHFLDKYLELVTPKEETKGVGLGDDTRVSMAELAGMDKPDSAWNRPAKDLLSMSDKEISDMVHSIGVIMIGEDEEPEYRADDPMRHFSTARYCFEGIKEATVHYRCRRCRGHIYCGLAQLPQDIHPKCHREDTAEAGAGYVNQG